MKLYESGEYRASKNWPHALAAGCVVYREENGKIDILLLKRNAHHPNNPEQTQVSYNLPKGHLDAGEAPDAAALRETEEEAACTGEIETYLGAFSRTFVHPKFNIKNEKTVLFFALRWQRDLDSIDNEHDERVWVPLSEAPQLLDNTDSRGEGSVVHRLKEFLELAA
jgi:8-oxo-dGTP pyrophosphatase MutT (NUDIX family)